MTPEFARRRDSDMAAVATPLDDVFKECRDMDASLAERLASFAAAVHSRLPSFAAAVDRLVKRLSENGAGEAAPREGDPMPPFLLPDETNRLISLEQMLQTGPVAVTFHRGRSMWVLSKDTANPATAIPIVLELTAKPIAAGDTP
jgi:hypothetical protein